MLVIQAVSTYVDHGGKRDPDVFVCWWDSRNAVEMLVEGYREVRWMAYSQSITLSWVKLKMNSSMTRSVPTVRLTSSSFVSSGLLKTKWFV
jgi:hypothetical protein